MAQGMETLAVVIILAAIAYILYRWNARRNQIHCPNCGERIDLYADECPHCGYQKGEALKERLEEAQDLEEEMESIAEDGETVEEEEEAAGDHVCDQCGESFDSERGLSIHEGMKH
ncbi:MAG: hypothetical protein SVY41_03000 [Candidatus Nanohaloarchaea archaeon]|nr:hypothetical protein [Candidatus Nanohaloarchaea archaeon]